MKLSALYAIIVDRLLQVYLIGLLHYLFSVIILLNCNFLHAQFDIDYFEMVPIVIDGEAISNIATISQDQAGYIWVGTNLGLVRYDGYAYKKYKHIKHDSTSLPDNNIESLLVDHFGVLWVGTLSGLSRYNESCDCFIRYVSTADHTTPTGFITDMAEDHSHNLWLTAESGGLYRYEREYDRFTRFLDQPEDSISIVHDHVRHLLIDHTNTIWIGMGFGAIGSGLVRFNPNTGTAKRFTHQSNNKNSLIDNRISSLYEDHQGQLFVGTFKCGLHLYNAKKDVFNRIEYDPSHPKQLHPPFWDEIITPYGQYVEPMVRIIHEDENGGYWIGTTGKGINYFNLDKKTYKFYSNDSGISGGLNNNYIWSHFEDRQGTLWLGTLGGGLYKKNLFNRQYILSDRLKNTERAYESPLNLGIVWLGSAGNGLIKLNLETNEITNYVHDPSNIKSIGHDDVRITYQDSDHYLWVGIGEIGGDTGGEDGKGGLDRMDIRTGTFEHFKIKQNTRDTFSNTVYDICEDQEGRLWLACGAGGLFRSDKDKKLFELYDFPNSDSISDNSVIYDIQMNPQGAIWAADVELVGDGKLYKYDKQKDEFIPFLKGFSVSNIIEDENGWFWISIWNGILHYNPADKTYRKYTTEDGLLSNEATYISSGADGNYWIGTRNGPCKLDTKTDKITSAELPIGRYGYGILRSSDGRIIVAGDGIIAFYPDQIKGNIIPPEIKITNFLVAENPQEFESSPSQKISLAHHQNDISIQYVGFHYNDPLKNEYQYKLTPINDTWISAGTERTARFPKLGNGSYTFQVKAANSNGIWNEDSAIIQFEINAPWWQTAWAYLIYALLLAGLIYAIYKFQLSKELAIAESQKLEEVNILKNTLYTNITHEFRTPLTVIQGMTEILRLNIQQSQFDKADESLNMIQHNSKKLLRLVNDMLDLSTLTAGITTMNIQQDDIVLFIRYLVESHESFALQQKKSLQFHSTEKKLMMDFDAKKLEQVLVNILSNAIKFTHEFGQILVDVKKIEKDNSPHLEIMVQDTGEGIAPEKLPYIFDRFNRANPLHSNAGTGIGLALVKELMIVMKGTINVESEPEKGTKFSLLFPIRNTAKLALNQETLAIDLVQPGEELRAFDQTKLNEEHPILLIIEDNVDVTHYLEICLEDQYQIQACRNGKNGVETALEILPDIIISDVMMPAMNGFEVTKTLKEDERTSHIPIILLTAKATLEDKLTGLTHGADAFLVKPFERTELIVRLDKLLEIRKTLQKKYSSSLVSSQPEISRANNKEISFLGKIEKIVLFNLDDERFNHQVLATKIFLSRSQVNRKIRALTGMSSSIYIRHIRLQKAKELLHSSELSISEIAYQVGFKTPVYFSQIFKETFGKSPSDTRK